MIPLDKVKDIIIRYETLEKDLSSGNVEPKLFAKKSKEYSDIGNIISSAKDYVNFESEKKGLEQILNDKSNDIEMINMARKDLLDIEEKKKENENKLKIYLLP